MEAENFRSRTLITNLVEEARYAHTDDDSVSSSDLSDNDADSEPDPPKFDMADILEDLHTYTQCLVDLSPSLVCPAKELANLEGSSSGINVQS